MNRESQSLSDIRAELRRRAEKIASAGDAETRRSVAGRFAVLSLASHSVGIALRDLREIVRTPPIACMPNLPPWLKGVVQIRGDIVSVVDLASLYGLQATTTGGFLALTHGASGDVGILADDVLGFRDVFTDEISSGGQDPAAEAGIPSVGTTGDLLILVDVKRLMSEDRIMVSGGTPLSKRDVGQCPSAGY